MLEFDAQNRPVVAGRLALDQGATVCLGAQTCEGVLGGIATGHLAEHVGDVAGAQVPAHHDVGVIATPARDHDAGRLVVERLVDDAATSVVTSSMSLEPPSAAASSLSCA